MFKFFLILFVLVLVGDPIYNAYARANISPENRVPVQLRRTVQSTVSAAMTIDAWCFMFQRRRGVTDPSSSCTGIAVAGASAWGAAMTRVWTERDRNATVRLASKLREGIWVVRRGEESEEGGEV